MWQVDVMTVIETEIFLENERTLLQNLSQSFVFSGSYLETY